MTRPAPSARAISAALELREQCRRILAIEGYDMARANGLVRLEDAAADLRHLLFMMEDHQ